MLYYMRLYYHSVVLRLCYDISCSPLSHGPTQLARQEARDWRACKNDVRLETRLAQSTFSYIKIN